MVWYKAAATSLGRVLPPTAAVVLMLNCLWLMFLILAFMVYSSKWSLGLAWEDAVKGKDPIGGLVPMLAPWAGCLGGVTISIVGVAKHLSAKDWGSEWFGWHLARPVLGAVSGTIAFVIVIVVLRTAGGLDSDSTTVPSDFLSRGLFLVIGFVAGFRDRMFLNLIAKVADVLFATKKA